MIELNHILLSILTASSSEHQKSILERAMKAYANERFEAAGVKDDLRGDERALGWNTCKDQIQSNWNKNDPRKQVSELPE